MGDSGSLSLGGMLAVVALITGQVLILPLIGIIFVLEVASDVIQVASFKIRHKRVFRMAPLHHHFELGGWDEEKITMRFWIVGGPGGHARGDALRRLDPEAVSDAGRRRPGSADRGRRPRRCARTARSVTVLGLARSGIALARFFADAGASVTVYDGRAAADLATRDRAAGRTAGRAAARARRSIRRTPGPMPISSPPRRASTPTSPRPSPGCGPRSAPWWTRTRPIPAALPPW